MIKIKMKLLLPGLVATAAIMAMSASPAGAWFKSLNGTSQGQGKAQKTTFVEGAAKVSCESADAGWHLQSKGKFEEHEQGGKQVATTEGPHLYIKVSKWNGCKATIGVTSVAATVTACEFQLVQPQKGSGTGTVTIIRPCTIETPKPAECKITVFAGKEATGLNAFLPGASFEQSQKNIIGSAKIENIHGKNEICASEEFVAGKFVSEGTIIGYELELV